MSKAVILARASSGKQVIEGDTLPDQIRQCTDFISKQGWKIAKIFSLVESGRIKEREFFNEVLEYCKDKNNKIDYVVFKNISRFTRGGEEAYLQLKSDLKKHDVNIRDIYGTIQEEVNSMETYGFKYDWSIFSPSQSEESYQAKKAKDAVRDSLTQMIGAEIGYVRKGYWSRNPLYGFQNKRIETSNDGRRIILEEAENEAYFVKKAFKLATNGNYSYEEITKKLNKLGFKTRRYCKRDKKTKRVTGYGGENPLEVKQLQRMLKKPTYAGVICEKWTHYQPVKAKFDGLVDIQTFNQANLGKVRLIDEGGSISIKYNERPAIRSKNNPLYPFKEVVKCSQCNNSLKGSASTGKLGKRYPAYHCSRGHKYWRVPRKEFHETVYDFLGKLKFDKGFTRLFEGIFLEVWKDKRASVVAESQKAEENVSGLLSEQRMSLEALKRTASDVVKEKLERDVERIEEKINQARSIRREKEEKEIDVKLMVKYAVYFMEHLEELLIDEANPLQQQQLFGALFTEMPTYEDLVSGTPNLSPIFGINLSPEVSKTQLVTPRGIEPRFAP